MSPDVDYTYVVISKVFRSSKKSFPIKSLDLLSSRVETVQQQTNTKDYIRRGPSFFPCAIAFSFMFMCKWTSKQRHLWPSDALVCMDVDFPSRECTLYQQYLLLTKKTTQVQGGVCVVYGALRISVSVNSQDG